MAEGAPAVDFAPARRGGRSFRKRKAGAVPEPAHVTEDAAPAGAELDTGSTVRALRDLQKLRQRQRGVASMPVATSQDTHGLREEQGNNAAGGEIVADLGSTFTQETAAGRELDPNMLQYIEEAMGQKQGVTDTKPPVPDDELDLYKAPGNLLPHKSAEAGAAQESREDAQRWLAGIEEIPLAPEEKLQSVEETEKAKARLLENLEAKMRAPPGTVPRTTADVDLSARGNVASNFQLHRKSALRLVRHPAVTVLTPLRCLPRRPGNGAEARTGPRGLCWRWPPLIGACLPGCTPAAASPPRSGPGPPGGTQFGSVQLCTWGAGAAQRVPLAVVTYFHLHMFDHHLLAGRQLGSTKAVRTISRRGHRAWQLPASPNVSGACLWGGA